MYVVFKGKRPAGNKKFLTYEEGRQYARKRVRKLLDGFPKDTTSNPPINLFGYSVRQVG